MKREDIEVGKVYAVVRGVGRRREKESADSYIRVLDTSKWWEPSYYGYGRSSNYTEPVFQGKRYRVSERYRIVDKYPSDGTKGVLGIRVNYDGEDVGDRASVFSTASIVGTKEDFEAHVAQLRKERAERNAEREREQAEKFNRWENLNKGLVDHGLPAIKAEVEGWNGLPRTSWKNYRFDGGWIFTDDEVQFIIDRVAQLEEELLYASLGEDA